MHAPENKNKKFFLLTSPWKIKTVQKIYVKYFLSDFEIFLDNDVFSTLYYSFSRISHEEYIIYPPGPIPPWLYTVPGFLRDIEDVHPDVGAGSDKI